MTTLQMGNIPTNPQNTQSTNTSETKETKQPIRMYELLPRIYQMLPGSELSAYQSSAKASILMKDMTDWLAMSYGLYMVLCAGKVWFRLTSNPISTIMRMASLAILPEYIFSSTASKLNHTLFNNNKHIFLTNFSQDEINRIDFQTF